MFGLSGASPAAEAVGNGFLVKNGEQVIARDVIGVHPVRVDNGTGVTGSLVISGVPQRVLASGVVNGAITTDQALPVIGIEEYIIRSVVFTRASVVPVAATGGVYTRYSKSGQTVVSAATVFTTLTEPRKLLEVAVSLEEIVSAPFIYFSLTAGNSAPLTMECYVLGDVLRYASA
jgi:hypothetical protein